MDDIKPPYKPQRAQLAAPTRRDYGITPTTRHATAAESKHSKTKKRPAADYLTAFVRRWAHTVAIYYRRLVRHAKKFWKGSSNWYRGYAFLAVVLLVISFIASAANPFLEARPYKLSDEARRLLPKPSKQLAEKLVFDGKTGDYAFNADYSPQTGDGSKKSVGGAFISATFNKDPTKGITITDPISKSDFSAKPKFHLGEAKQQDNQIFYSLEGDGFLVYSAQANGVKEDIILNQYTKDTMTFVYDLQLGDTLAARLEKNGALGIYGSDSPIGGQVSTGSDKDAALLQKARKNLVKDKLLFAIPAPVIKETNHKTSKAKAHFELDGSSLKVVAEHLKTANYPLSVDPTVLVTNGSTDFLTGNNESGTDIDLTLNQIVRGNQTGGYTGTNTVETAVTTNRLSLSVVIYNSYLYAIGGTNGNTRLATVYVTKLSSTGLFVTPGASFANCSSATWCKVNNDLPTVRYQHSSVVYNGYIYVIAGENSGGVVNTITCAPFDTTQNNGDLGTWSTCGATPASRYLAQSVVYNNYLYWFGGTTNGTTVSNSVGHNVINADGVIGDGTSTSWTSDGNMLTGRFNFGAAVYGNYLYALGGVDVSTIPTSNAEYIKINNDGTLGNAGVTWIALSALPTVLEAFVASAYNGYLYLATGCTAINVLGCSTQTNTIYYALLNANGTTGAWKTTNTAGTARSDGAGGIYKASGGNVVLYTIAGCTGFTTLFTCSTTVNETDSNTIAAVAAAAPIATSSSGQVRFRAATVVYNGFMYLIGGCTSNSATCGTNTNRLSTIRFSKLADDGTFGTWATTATAMPNFTGELAPRYGMAAVASHGQLFVIGGVVRNTADSADVYTKELLSVPLDNNTGETGVWVTSGPTPSYTVGRYASAVYNNGYMYVIGGDNNGTYNPNIEKLAVNLDGTLGAAWSTTGMTNLPVNKAQGAAAVYNGYLYVAGGFDGTTFDGNVRYSLFNSTGGNGAWSSASATFTTARRGLGMAISNGYMYVLGGCVTTTTDFCGAGNYKSDIQYAPITNAGNISATWATATNSLTTAVYQFQAVAANGTLYAPNGCDSTACTGVTNVQFARINNGGPGPVVSFTAANSLTAGRSYFGGTAAVVNGWIYVPGGCNTSTSPCTGLSSVDRAQLKDDGTLTTWATTGALNNPRFTHSLAAYNGYIYVISGCMAASGCGTTTTDISRAKPDASGVISAGGWTDQTPTNFGTFRLYSAAVAYNGFLYVSGGETTSAARLNTTIYASLDSSTGAVGSFSAASNDFATARERLSLVAYNGYLYVLGGCTTTANCTTVIANDMDDVQMVPINSNGNLTTAWKQIATLPLGARAGLSASAGNGYIYITGGSDTSNNRDVSFAPILGTGYLGQWQATDIFATGRSGHGAVVANGNLYIIGGNSSSVPSTSVQSGTIMATAYKSAYSRQSNTEVDTTPRNIVFRGTYANSITTSVVLNHFMAPSSTAVYGSLNSTSGILPEIVYSLTASSGGVDRYYLIRFAIDDSQAAVFPDVPSAIADYDIYFSANTAKRLRGGRTFTNGVINNLDAHP